MAQKNVATSTVSIVKCDWQATHSLPYLVFYMNCVYAGQQEEQEGGAEGLLFPFTWPGMKRNSGGCMLTLSSHTKME